MGNGKKLLMNAVEPYCFAENMTPLKHEGLRAVGGLDRIATPPCNGIPVLTYLATGSVSNIP